MNSIYILASRFENAYEDEIHPHYYPTLEQARVAAQSLVEERLEPYALGDILDLHEDGPDQDDPNRQIKLSDLTLDSTDEEFLEMYRLISPDGSTFFRATIKKLIARVT